MKGSVILCARKPVRLVMAVLFLFPGVAWAQANKNIVTNNNKSISSNKVKADTLKNTRPEVFTSGFFDVINSGQINASARLVRLYIGEQGKFHFPLSIFSGVSSNNFQSSQNTNRSNDQLVNNFINPLTGIANISVEGIKFRDTTAITRAGFIYSVGERILTGYKIGTSSLLSSGKPVNFLNSYIVGGGYFQTGAWERSNSSNMGVFWLGLRYIATYTNGKLLESFMPAIVTNGFYHGYSIGGGIEINRLVNMKVIFFNYVKAPEIEYGLPIYQFSFNYYMK
jgi:hypothetical protein